MEARSPPGRLPPVADFRFAALILTGVLLVVYPLQAWLPMDDLVLVSSEAAQRPWTLLTSIFLHGSPEHLLGNAFALALFGTILERLVGWRRLLGAFFAAGLVSAAGDLLFYEASLGASGGIFGVIGAVAALRPRMAVPAFGVPLPMAAAAALWVGFDLTGTLYPDGIAHVAHLLGIGVGIAFGLWIRPELPQPKKKRTTMDEGRFREWEEVWMQSPYPEDR